MQFSIEFAFRVNLQEERCEQWVSDAGRMISLLLCDIASLSRLSITSIWQPAARPQMVNLNRSLRSRTCEADYTTVVGA